MPQMRGACQEKSLRHKNSWVAFGRGKAGQIFVPENLRHSVGHGVGDEEADLASLFPLDEPKRKVVNARISPTSRVSSSSAGTMVDAQAGGSVGV